MYMSVVTCSNSTHAISIRYDLLTQHIGLQYTHTDNKINDLQVHMVSERFIQL